MMDIIYHRPRFETLAMRSFACVSYSSDVNESICAWQRTISAEVCRVDERALKMMRKDEEKKPTKNNISN